MRWFLSSRHSRIIWQLIEGLISSFLTTDIKNWSGPFTIWQQKPEFSVGSLNGSGHSTGTFSQKMEMLRCIPLFPFQPKWLENSVPFVKIMLGPVHFRAQQLCRYFVSSFFVSCRGLRPAKPLKLEKPYHMKLSIPTGFFVQMVNAPKSHRLSRALRHNVSTVTSNIQFDLFSRSAQAYFSCGEKKRLQ